jgi:hypothetical protein|tara:strand:- start:400 stop:726 length:327 start_codon:yes stop_codon:yes gene_type:complete
MEKEIGKISKGEYQGVSTDIIVGVKEFNGRIGVDIREFTTSESYTGPTKKGLRIPAERFEEFQRMISLIKPEDLQLSEAPQESSPTTEKLETENSQDELSGIDEQGLM